MGSEMCIRDRFMPLFSLIGMPVSLIFWIALILIGVCIVVAIGVHENKKKR